MNYFIKINNSIQCAKNNSTDVAVNINAATLKFLIYYMMEIINFSK